MLQLLHKEYSLTFPTLLYGQALVYTAEQLSELGGRGENENTQTLKRQQRKFKSRLSRLRVRSSTAEIPCSSVNVNNLLIDDFNRRFLILD